MAEQLFDRVNDFNRVKINLASPNDIRSWSFGEVKKPETINYRTYRPEKDGLFCERIFGPERDYECACGKYKGTKFKGIICDRCGVKVTHSRVRRKRMGHINLAAPIVHIWFFKAIPSHLGNLLGMKTSDLEKVIYFQDYVVVDPGDTPLKQQQILTEDDYRHAISEYGRGFTAMMGAEAVKELLARLELAAVAAELREELAATKSKQKIKDLSKRLRIVELIRHSENDPAWMVMDVVPVIPPDLRPLVLLDSGNFATSDLNDLYRRIINRNNRLKKLMDLNAPEVIIRNEKRMLQQSVDALFDNGRCRRPVLGSSNRPLKSLTDMIKGKQGRFRENLLGKRVDYSARSVIVVGPELKLHQCGLPKKIALELFQPFIIRRLKEHGLVDTIKSAKKMLERRDPEVWDVLEEVIDQHPVLLNRAPTLHRMGIQAFEPVLVEGNAIRIHPLVCSGFNADFDGDQMAVHLPLSVEAQAEAHILMLSPHNIFSPANGSPIISAGQDIVYGVYYMTLMPQPLPDDVVKELVTRSGELSEEMVEQMRQVPEFRNESEAFMAYQLGKIKIHDPIVARIDPKRYQGVVLSEKSDVEPFSETGRVVTTVGRLIFNEILAEAMPFYNCPLGKKGCSRVIDDTYASNGRPATIDLLDHMKRLGFQAATNAGLSLAITDLRIPERKQDILGATQKKVDRVEKAYEGGALTERERYNQLVDLWTHCREEITKQVVEEMKRDRRAADGRRVSIDDPAGMIYLNPAWVEVESGARGKIGQLQQLAGMRGLMAKPSGEIIETPIKANAREGLSVLEYFSSTHGARKGLADTALKTADSGYLTRKLCDVAQNVFVTQDDCQTKQGITKKALYKGEEIDVPLRDQIIGRTARETIRNPITDELIVAENEVFTDEIARKIEALGIDSVNIRSPLSCESREGICAKCYGIDMSTSKLVEQGLAIGIIAAESIGEPGTQLTMRTFHTGGVATTSAADTSFVATQGGTIEIRDANEVTSITEDGDEVLVTLKRNGELLINDDKGRELEKFKLQYGCFIHVKPGEKVKKGTVLVTWDPHRTAILAEKGGKVRYEDIIVGETVRPEQQSGAKGAGAAGLVVIEHKGELHPRIVIEDSDGKILDFHYLPAKARIDVVEGQEVEAGHMLARQPREATGTADIVGGLPRVTEIFEARKPKDAAVMAEISGTVELRNDKRRGKMTVIVRSDSGLEVDHHVPQDRHLLVHTNDFVEAGDQLIEGPLVPQDILAIKGEEALFIYLINEVQNVYRAQGVPINDKHIEIIVNQMLRKVRVENPGDTNLLPNEVLDKWRFREANEAVASMGKIKEPGDSMLPIGAKVTKAELKEINAQLETDGQETAKASKCRPASGKTLLLGITKASLQSESFLSGASFQETTKVLTDAALAGRTDSLQGLKENVLLGHLIPVGTGFKDYVNLEVVKLAEPPDSEMLSREEELEAAAAMAEAAGAESPEDIGTTVGESRLVAQLLGEDGNKN
ncbi:DNA-directed RNA polymerase subunit beta' [Mucisphaera calidilacus]|uniref:DNA-directed RNA polymerase subunit beta' n=1 Tax=Mucisphaera calidilacus TaxID=2527982 RepID=A0A518BYK9_9BACT|nr:DNA-directed RNA polymerase subunit beta' [Mucisphaera calidilacus]QDU72056.1 DNA-directed RNA polymerase subunit beta' [Mucisphaera calidilacus]